MSAGSVVPPRREVVVPSFVRRGVVLHELRELRRPQLQLVRELRVVGRRGDIRRWLRAVLHFAERQLLEPDVGLEVLGTARRHGEPLLGLLPADGPDQVLQVLAERVGEQLLLEPLDNVLIYLHDVVGVEGRPAGHHDEEQDAERPPIHRAVVADLLSVSVAQDHLGEAQVGEDGVAVLVQEHVFQFQIPVDDLARVQVLEAEDRAGAPEARVRLRAEQVLVLREHLVQLTPKRGVHEEVHVLLVAVRAMQRHYEPAIEHHQGLPLADDMLLQVFPLGVALGQRLQRVQLAGRLALLQRHEAEGAVAERADRHQVFPRDEFFLVLSSARQQRVQHVGRGGRALPPRPPRAFELARRSVGLLGHLVQHISQQQGKRVRVERQQGRRLARADHGGPPGLAVQQRALSEVLAPAQDVFPLPVNQHLARAVEHHVERAALLALRDDPLVLDEEGLLQGRHQRLLVVLTQLFPEHLHHVDEFHVLGVLGLRLQPHDVSVIVPRHDPQLALPGSSNRRLPGAVVQQRQLAEGVADAQGAPSRRGHVVDQNLEEAVVDYEEGVAVLALSDDVLARVHLDEPEHVRHGLHLLVGQAAPVREVGVGLDRLQNELSVVLVLGRRVLDDLQGLQHVAGRAAAPGPPVRAGEGALDEVGVVHQPPLGADDRHETEILEELGADCQGDHAPAALRIVAVGAGGDRCSAAEVAFRDRGLAEALAALQASCDGGHRDAAFA
eukprot:CAMPEP_0198619050 /NCGR_PEP_ID=MMETSP1462-20131121/161196_1 /TAXON_ID=1333877 /ORGANISM="Brandtodinium nutriculum, Strain RCC3387" /LENGTH=725 /DNA_ID=CAMNT_0044350849 /DNA_START=50 /DNA_END=2225 /DNA_ORIENTATION=+